MKPFIIALLLIVQSRAQAETTFCISIYSGENYILGTTARVPTLNHPENFTDLHIPNGPRLAVNCEMKP